MTEETETTGNQRNSRELEARLERIKNEYIRENRYWRAGLIAALVLVATSMFFGGFHQHRPPPPRGFPPMAMGGWVGQPGFMPVPPRWAFGGPAFAGPGFGGCGCGRYQSRPQGDHGSPGGAPGPLGNLGPMNGPTLQVPSNAPNGYPPANLNRWAERGPVRRSVRYRPGGQPAPLALAV